MHDVSLDPEEEELLKSVENGEWQPVAQVQEAISRYQQYAVEASGGQQEVTITLPQKDLNLLKAKAREAGVSTETLIIRLVHGFVSS